MPAITGSDTFFTNIDADYTATKWEACIEQAIDKINGYARDDIIPSMTGAAGSKTVTVSSGEAGFIRDIAAKIYANMKTSGASSHSYNMGIYGESTSSSSGGAGEIEELAENAALQLKEIEVSYG
jgi:hypothetical protein